MLRELLYFHFKRKSKGGNKEAQTQNTGGYVEHVEVHLEEDAPVS